MSKFLPPSPAKKKTELSGLCSDFGGGNSGGKLELLDFGTSLKIKKKSRKGPWVRTTMPMAFLSSTIRQVGSILFHASRGIAPTGPVQAVKSLRILLASAF